jgi:type I restriction enzyme S subunit
MKNGWKTVPLESLAVQQKGAIKIGPFGSQLKKCDLVTSGVHVVGIENVLAGRFDGLGERYISPQKFHTLRTVEILPGDLLITMMGTIGKVAIVPDGIGKSIMDSHLLRVRPSQALCRTDYLAWAIYGSPAVQLAVEAQAHGAIMQGLNSAIVRSLPILLPPIPDQKRIVGVLDEAFEGIAIAKANTEKNLQNAHALFESYLQAVFADAWQKCELAKLSDLATDITDGDHLPPPKSPSGVPFITIGKIVKQTRKIDFTETFTVPHAYFNALKPNKRPKKGDVLYTVTGSFGIPVIVRDNVEFCFQRHIGLIRPKSETNSTWLYYLLMSPQIFTQANDGATGTAQKTVSLKLLRSFEVPRVAPKQQETVVAKLDALSVETQRLASLYESKLAALDALKKSLLHQAFTGQL